MKIIMGILIACTLIAGFSAILLAYKVFRQQKAMTYIREEIQKRDGILSAINESMGRQILFIHHSVGEQWLNEGGLRPALIKYGLGVHDATYGDKIGEYTDICDWTEKFTNHMDDVMRFNYHPDSYYNDNTQNDIIMFKSCYPNNQIVGDGTPPGNPGDKTKLISNFEATFDSLRVLFSKYPEKTFIYVTSPPLVPGQTDPGQSERARSFANWVKGDFLTRYKSETNLSNMFVFDLFDILADQSGCLRTDYRRSDSDSHPNATGLKEATNQFIDFLHKNEILKDS